nr:PREDICTED: ankyrin repeat and SOCS box protein 18 [Equus przewalskii]
MTMASADCLPNYPLDSDLVKRFKSALDASDEERVSDLLCTEVEQVDATIEMANDDWMKDPSAQLPPGVLLGNLDRLKPLMDQFFQDANVVFEIKKDEMEWQVKSTATFGPSGLWTLEYKRELTTPLCISAARGHTACVSHLLARGADPDASPGGRGALHEACLGGHTACAQLLLQHRADPDLLSAEGLAPLHLCRTAASLGCAQALLEHGASVQRAGGSGGDTPLHVAAQHGLDEHARLYLGRGAPVDARNGRGETALGAAALPRLAMRIRWAPCCLVLICELTAVVLEQACCTVTVIAPVPFVTEAWGVVEVGCRHTLTSPHSFPARTQNPVCQPSLPISHQVLKTCASAPEVVEVLFNSYPQLRVSESWKEAIPEEVFEMHQPFYKSFFALAHTPRCLQHLCRCAIRKLFGKNCFYFIPLLPLPKSLQNYLLLEPEGVLH